MLRMICRATIGNRLCVSAADTYRNTAKQLAGFSYKRFNTVRGCALRNVSIGSSASLMPGKCVRTALAKRSGPDFI